MRVGLGGTLVENNQPAHTDSFPRTSFAETTCLIPILEAQLDWAVSLQDSQFVFHVGGG